MKTIDYILAVVVAILVALLWNELNRIDEVCVPEHDYMYAADARFRKVFGPVDTEVEQRLLDCIVYGDGCELVDVEVPSLDCLEE